MGIKTVITLHQAQQLFPSFHFKELRESSNGVVDTTYILDKYILKFYERDIQKRISQDAELLRHLNQASLHVPLLLAHNEKWYLYTRLQGEAPKAIKLFHIQSLARFMAKLHKKTLSTSCDRIFLDQYKIETMLCFTKKNFFFFYKKLESLKVFQMNQEGFIHGDIFTDNTLFHKNKIAVFDFIDSGSGEFVFDLGVALSSFNPYQRKLYTKIFLNTYNQLAPKKISHKELLENIKIASQFYALLRIDKYKNTKKAKELANLW